MARSATAAPAAPSPTTQHKRLELFVGKWNVAGVQRESRVGPAAEISGTERFEWLEGGLFLIHHFHATVSGAPAACIEIIEYDASSETYPTHTYYNNGQRAEWRLAERDGAWTITGEWPMPGGPMQVRCTVEFGDEGNTRTGKWESSSDGERWETFWDVRATRG
jgi:hypothetical protein